MTIEELIVIKQFDVYYEWIDLDEVKEAMKEYAKEKCQELLEIVAQKAKTKIDDFGGSFRGGIIIDKTSILKAVNLDEFIN